MSQLLPDKRATVNDNFAKGVPYYQSMYIALIQVKVVDAWQGTKLK